MGWFSQEIIDINNDGYIDLFVTAEGHLSFGGGAEQHEDRLYLNNGNLTFDDITESAGVQGGLGSCATSFSHFDGGVFAFRLPKITESHQFTKNAQPVRAGEVFADTVGGELIVAPAADLFGVRSGENFDDVIGSGAEAGSLSHPVDAG